MNINEKSVKKSRGNTAPLKNLMVLDTLASSIRNRAYHLPGIGVFYGPSGFGKSTAASYTAGMNQAVYLEYRSHMSRKSFLEAFCGCLGIVPYTTVSKMASQIAEELATSQTMVIIDEFDTAVTQPAVVELVRDIYEQSRAPIILIGEELLPQKLQKWERFAGRIMDWAQAVPIDLEDARNLNSHFAPNVKVTDDLLKVLVNLARGSIRRVVTNLERINQFALGESLKEIGVKEWGDRPLHMAHPPKERKGF